MVIVEGPDHAGKSTLIRHIQEYFGDAVELSPHSRLTKDARNDPRFRDNVAVHERVYSAIAHKSPLTSQGPVQVHDRLFFSELVYGEVLRGESSFNWDETTHVRRLLTAITPPIIFCLPPLANIHETMFTPEAREMEGVTDNIDAIYEAYNNLSVLVTPRITLYDYTRGPAAKQRICRVIEAYMARRKRRRFTP